MWIRIVIGALVFLALSPLVVVTYSFIRTVGGRRYDPRFFEKDRGNRPGLPVKRCYRGVGHMFFRVYDLLGYAYPLVRVYVFRSLPPKFREKIMLVTAMGNDCRH
jgi:hypothetical protein